MRRKCVLITAMVVLASLLGGCGVAPYELTSAETDLIANYSAHIVSKYNLYQKDGIKYVEEEEETEEASSEETSSEESAESTEESAENVELTASSGSGDAGAEEEADTTATFNDIFAADGIDISVKDTRIATSYVEDKYFALDADSDKVYVIVEIDVTNNGSEDAEIDYLSMQPSFKVTVNGEYSAKSEMTILMNDFSTYTGTIAAGETAETVLLFQVSEDVTQIDDISLTAAVGGENYKIEF